jgi:hypothetical protein
MASQGSILPQHPQVPVADTTNSTLSAGSTWLYEHWFKSSVNFAYDERIKEYNWYLVLGAQVVFFFVLHVLVRLLAPSPGLKEDFIGRKKLREYYFYYFQYTSLFHALTSIFLGKAELRLTSLQTPGCSTM